MPKPERPTDVECSACGALPGEECVGSGPDPEAVYVLSQPHNARLELHQWELSRYD